MVYLKSRHWLEDKNENIIFGEGRKEILENIEKTRSINKTAKLMNMSYRAVWGKIKATEEHLKMTIVKADRKSGTILTTQGKDLLDRYKRLKKECIKADDEIFKNIFLNS